MKILVVTNLYPPIFLGGYELACQEVCSFMRSRGHQVSILTSSWNVPASLKEEDVQRRLKFRLWFEPSASRLKKWAGYFFNRRIFQKVLKEKKPDLIIAFSLSTLGGLLIDALHRQPVPVVHEIGDTALADEYKIHPWFVLWARSEFLSHAFSNLFGFKKPELNLRRSYFRSAYLKNFFSEKNFEVLSAPVFHHGIRRFEKRPFSEKLRGVLYLGRISPEKGIHVFFKALEQVKNASCLKGVPITIAGGAVNKEYEAGLMKQAENLKGRLDIRFTGHLEKDKAIEVLRQHDILVFPSTWDEPFGLAPLEAAANGLAVITTATGGAGEVIQNEINGLHVRREDPEAIAQALIRLAEDGDLRNRLMEAAYRRAESFNWESSMEKVEAHLLKAAGF